MSTGIQARPVGRILRFLTGAALTAEAVRHMIGADTQLNLSVFGVVLALVVFYSLVHVAVSKFAPTINRWLGAVIAITPVIVVFLLGGPPGQLGTLLFIGVSLLLTAVRADGGCEVMTLPGMLFGNRTHLCCIVFSPIDWLENRLVRSSPQHTTPEP